MKISSRKIHNFRTRVYSYYNEHKRDLPWRTKYTQPYHILVSEIMLQQTQVDRVKTKFINFITTFPAVPVLAGASFKKVLQQWHGLGYNRRARYLHRCAKHIVTEHNGEVPASPAQLTSLPGIGAATAAAVCVYAFNQPLVYIETNIRAVFIHHFFSGIYDIPDNEIHELVEQTLDYSQPAVWYSALMDYGTWIKKEFGNPAKKSRHHTVQSPFIGSDRQMRGKILRLLTREKMTACKLIRNLDKRHEADRVKRILRDLLSEGLITKSKRSYTIEE